jgi:hypothetical protein
MKQNPGMWRYLIFGPDEEMRGLLKGFNEEPPSRREYLSAVWWNWRKQIWRSVLRKTICRLMEHDYMNLEPSELFWYGALICRRCSRQVPYLEDGSLWSRA